MKISLAVSVSRRMRMRALRQRKKKKELRLIAKRSVMFVSSNGKSFFKLLN